MIFKRPLFSYGFRPFFILAGLQAIFSVALWVHQLHSETNIIIWDSPALWHGHEMVYGFAMAVVAGFLLTAVPKWTGSEHLSGTPIGLLTIVWLLGRISMFNLFNSPWILAIIDISFIPAVMVALAKPILHAKKLKNIAFLGLLSVLTITNIFIHLQQMGLSEHGHTALLIAVFIILQMIVIIGGRVIPVFTKNALMHKNIQVRSKPQPQVNLLAIISLPFILIAGLLTSFEHPSIKTIIAIAAIVHLIRLANWHGIKAYKLPIVWILHLGYLWLIVGLLFLAFGNMYIAMHAFTTGTIATMILGMTSRVALGHTGRPIHATLIVIAAYISLQLAVIARILAPLTDFYNQFIIYSTVFWIVAFTLFLIRYIPILTSRSK